MFCNTQDSNVTMHQNSITTRATRSLRAHTNLSYSSTHSPARVHDGQLVGEGASERICAGELLKVAEI